MKKQKINFFKACRNTVSVLRMQIKISKKPVLFDIFTAFAEKCHRLLEITFPAVVIDLLTVKNRWNYAVLMIFLFSFLITVLDFAIRRIRELLSAHGERTDNYVTLSVCRKNMCTDYRDTLSAEQLNTAAKGKRAISEFLEIDYILFTRILGSLFSITILSYLIFQLDIVALAVTVAAALILYFLEGSVISLDHKYETMKNASDRKLQYMEEVLFDFSYGKDIRIYNCADFLKNKFLKIADAVETLEKERIVKRNRIVCVKRLVQCVQISVMYIFAILKFTVGNITLGSFTIYLNAAKEFSDSLQQLLDSIVEIKRVNVYFDDYDAYMRTPQTIISSGCDTKESRPIPSQDMIIQFENVSFRYPGNGQYALKNISFSIRTGETLSIVGDNGAGKTTLLCLLLRLFDPTEGTITLNGVDLREYPYEEYRKLLAPVFQDGELFSYSLRENVVFDKPVDKVRLWDCYAAADLKKKIDSLSSGDDTVMTKDLDENGEELSGGETQKVFMARAYFHGGEILILDEPTAAIDPISEHKIYQKVAEYRKGKICVFITHRLTSTLFADKIIVLENGNMVQMGSHKNLVKEKELYVEMFEKQAHYYRD